MESRLTYVTCQGDAHDEGQPSTGTCRTPPEQDEDGICCAAAQLRPGVGAMGDGETPEAAPDDFREVLQVLVAEVGHQMS